MKEFACYSQEEGLERCSRQCTYCRKHYEGIKEPKKVTLRIPGHIYFELSILAKKENRSMSNLMNTMLKDGLNNLNNIK